MKKYLLVLALCSFTTSKKESEVSIRANDFMAYCNANKIKAQVVFVDSIYITKLTNY